jgi:hypothetical protein
MAHAIPLPARGRRPGVAWPAAALLVTVAVGVPVEAAVYPDDAAAAAGDLAVAIAFVVCGAAVWSPLRNGDLTGPLLVATGATWLAGGVVDELALLHRGPLIHLLVTAPGGRPRTVLEWLVVGASYGLAVLPEVARTDGATAALALALTGMGVTRCVRARGILRRARVVPAAAATAVALVLALGTVAGPADGDAVLWIYEGVLAATAAAFFVDLR